MRAKKLIEILEQYPDFEVKIMTMEIVDERLNYNSVGIEISDIGHSDGILYLGEIEDTTNE